jgi:hypothetical protein
MAVRLFPVYLPADDALFSECFCAISTGTHLFNLHG